MAVLAAETRETAVLVTFLVVVIVVVRRSNPQRSIPIKVLGFAKHPTWSQRSVVPLARGALAAEGVHTVAVLAEIAISAKTLVEALRD